jgi:hypothetical protein
LTKIRVSKGGAEFWVRCSAAKEVTVQKEAACPRLKKPRKFHSIVGKVDKSAAGQ